MVVSGSQFQQTLNANRLFSQQWDDNVAFGVMDRNVIDERAKRGCIERRLRTGSGNSV